MSKLLNQANISAKTGPELMESFTWIYYSTTSTMTDRLMVVVEVEWLYSRGKLSFLAHHNITKQNKTKQRLQVCIKVEA